VYVTAAVAGQDGHNLVYNPSFGDPNSPKFIAITNNLCSPMATFISQTATVATTIPLTTITGLNPCTIYSIAFKTVGAGNNEDIMKSEFSTPLLVKTVVEKPAPVDSVTVTPLNANSVTVVIADSAARSCGTPAYTVSIRNTATDITVVSDTSPGKTFVLDGLTNTTDYVAEALVFDSATNVYSAP
ncbi:hypothetical protein Ciccas_012380, partial [Cichlidogyrus casuarinus]